MISTLSIGVKPNLFTNSFESINIGVTTNLFSSSINSINIGGNFTVYNTKLQKLNLGVKIPKLTIKVIDKDAKPVGSAIVAVNGVETTTNAEGIAYCDFTTGENASIKITHCGMIDVEFCIQEHNALSLIIPMFKQNDVYVSSDGVHVNLVSNKIDNCILI